MATAQLTLTAQPATEVYIFDLEKTGETYQLSNAKNISGNPGKYDNQPSFSEDGNTVHYVAQDETGFNDIYFYNLKSDSKTNFSKTPAASEYSPTLTPDGSFISCIRVVGDEQLLWKFPLVGGEPVVVVPELVIGYHAWWSENILVSFVLGEPHTLQVLDLTTSTQKVVAENIGRAIFKIPGESAISFLQNRDGLPALIQALNPETGEIKTVTEALPDSQDMAWTPPGEILMGQGNTLYIWSRSNPVWTVVTELDGLQGISRLAVSPNGRMLAVVVNE